MAISDYSTTASSNGSVLGVSIAEGATAPSSVNNALRQLCADIASGFNFAILGSFFSANSLAAARSALGVTTSTVALTSIDALTPAANKLPYYTSASAAALTDLTSFARTLLDDGDAATALATLGALGFVSVSFGSNSVAVSIKLNSSNTLLLQAGTVTVGANSDGTITFGTAYSTAPVCIVSGGPVGSGDAGTIHTQGVATTTSQAVSNTSGGSLTGSWFAIGKA